MKQHLLLTAEGLVSSWLPHLSSPENDSTDYSLDQTHGVTSAKL